MRIWLTHLSFKDFFNRQGCIWAAYMLKHFRNCLRGFNNSVKDN